MTESGPQRDTEAVLLVIRSQGNRKVLGRFLAEHGLRGLEAVDEDSLATALSLDAPIRLALVDVSGFGAGTWTLCERLRTAGVPFIVLSPSRGLRASHEALAYGALSVIEKPVEKAALIHLLKRLEGR
ncbi:response regulator [Saccharospirillum salsuginis]|uniref:Response regulatory domain-containing protein n=1 Tax=Saccharospirillum salsuginis TaxID=418750 RepID=A0A918KCB0_9GAMM|nr:response regulator [Saccharospirillum salsuginis]GGX56920.1 hypothetical protein GCM10007392_25490 [Saccharospirillum salsuginis]